MAPFKISFITLLVVLSSCSKDDSTDTRELLGHTLTIEKIAHGIGHKKPERYCKNCHGAHLQGGEGMIPSCYSCHGQNWLPANPDFSFAPSDHTVNNGGYYHHPDLNQPTQTCSNCHGTQLEGNPDSSRPSCYLCHSKKWP